MSDTMKERGFVYICVPVVAETGNPTDSWYEALRGQVKEAVAKDDFEWDDYVMDEEED